MEINTYAYAIVSSSASSAHNELNVLVEKMNESAVKVKKMRQSTIDRFF